MTEKDSYLLLLISELLDMIRQAKYITKFDVQQEYYNVCLREGDKYKAVFRTNQGLFEPTVMPFRLTNTPVTFQRFINHILADLINTRQVIVYLNDILIFANLLAQHNCLVQQVLKIIHKHYLFLKESKCEFAKTSIEYLSYIIREG